MTYVAKALVLLLAGAPLAGQDSREFIARARAATERFKDHEVAVAEGYVKVGPDFPAMGEHWVNGELVVRGEFDAARPAILTYATIAGRHTLTGAVYAIALGPGQKPPDALPGAHWHDHVGSIDEESLLFGHDKLTAGDDIRLVVMHAWLWVDNPSGMFATDNWSLPFARAGTRAPRDAGEDAARAMSLVTGSASYYVKLFAAAGRMDATHVGAVQAILERHAAQLEEWWRTREEGDVRSVEIARLAKAWQALEADVARAVPAEVAARLRRI